MPRVCPKRIWPYEADVNRTLLGESLPRFSLRWPAHSVGEAVALFFIDELGGTPLRAQQRIWVLDNCRCARLCCTEANVEREIQPSSIRRSHPNAEGRQALSD
jgi:hypothetical protein